MQFSGTGWSCGPQNNGAPVCVNVQLVTGDGGSRNTAKTNRAHAGKHRQCCCTECYCQWRSYIIYRAERNIAVYVVVKNESNITHRHAVQRKLAVNFELIGGRHPSTRVHQNIIELKTNSRGERNILVFIVLSLQKLSRKMIHLNWYSKALQKIP